MGNAAAVFNALPVKAAQLAEALRVKRESEGEAPAEAPAEASDEG
jgi:large subunit ribosomal protein L10